MSDTAKKRCLHCGRELVRRPGENATNARERNTCNQLCNVRYLAKLRTRPPHERFWEHVEKLSGDDACWVWTGRLDVYGYGAFGTASRAHRFSYTLANGPIPDGLIICHHCDNPRCVRPSHLFAGTMADNMRDMVEKGRSRGHRMTHCRQGHELTPENTIPRPDGLRRCLTCRRASQRKTDARRRNALRAVGGDHDALSAA